MPPEATHASETTSAVGIPLPRHTYTSAAMATARAMTTKTIPWPCPSENAAPVFSTSSSCITPGMKGWGPLAR